RLWRRDGLRRDRRSRRHAPADRRVLPRRVMWPVRPVPRRLGPPGGAARAARGRRGRAIPCRRAAAAGGHRHGDAGCEHLRPRPDGLVGHRVRHATTGARGPVSRNDHTLSGDRPMTQYSPGNMAPDLEMAEVIEGHKPAPYEPPPHLARVITTPMARATKVPAAPPVEAPAPVTVSI